MYKLELSEERAKDIVRQIRDLVPYGHLNFQIPCSYYPDWPSKVIARFFIWFGYDPGFYPSEGVAELCADTSYGVSLRVLNLRHTGIPSFDVKFKSLKQLERCLLYEAKSPNKARWMMKKATNAKEREQRKWQSFVGSH